MLVGAGLPALPTVQQPYRGVVLHSDTASVVGCVHHRSSANLLWPAAPPPQLPLAVPHTVKTSAGIPVSPRRRAWLARLNPVRPHDGHQIMVLLVLLVLTVALGGDQRGRFMAQAVVSAAERAALVQLYLATGGASWSRQVTGWRTDDAGPGPCDAAGPEWTGVSCDVLPGNATVTYVCANFVGRHGTAMPQWSMVGVDISKLQRATPLHTRLAVALSLPPAIPATATSFLPQCMYVCK
jgi:hypothetical protein